MRTRQSSKTCTLITLGTLWKQRGRPTKLLSGVLRHDQIVNLFEDARVSIDYIMNSVSKNRKTQKQALPIETFIDYVTRGANKVRFQVFMPKREPSKMSFTCEPFTDIPQPVSYTHLTLPTNREV